MTDTGILLSAARQPLSLSKISSHYKGRLASAKYVASEIARQARPGSRVEPRVRNAAIQAQQLLLNSGEVDLLEIEDQDVALFDQTARQLRSMPGASDENKSVHGGEAAIIAISRRLMDLGERVIMVANDGGAAQVAAAQGIPVIHFGHVLRELVCSGAMTSVDALEAFRFANDVSGIPSAVRPASEDFFLCAAAEGSCLRCKVDLVR